MMLTILTCAVKLANARPNDADDSGPRRESWNARPADAGDAGLCRGSGKARPTNDDDDAGLWRGFWRSKGE